MTRSSTDHLMCNFLKLRIWTLILVLLIIGQLNIVSVISPPVSPLTSEDNVTDVKEADLFEASNLVEEAEESSECVIAETLSSHVSTDQIEELSTDAIPCNVHTYKIIGDNIDFTVKARYNRIDSHKDRSLHYFHLMSVHNRINFTYLSITRPHSCLNSANKMASFLLPTKEFDNSLIGDISVLAS